VFELVRGRLPSFCKNIKRNIHFSEKMFENTWCCIQNCEDMKIIKNQWESMKMDENQKENG